MKTVRLNVSENEKLGLKEGLNVQSFKGDSLEEIAAKEEARKFNDQVEQFADQMEESNKKVQEAQKSINMDNVDIRPMYSRILVKPFDVNPFQAMKIESGIIVDAGGYTPHTQKNPITGKIEEQEQLIKCGAVVEVGPDTKYLQVGDVVYYAKVSAIPMPYFKLGLVSLDEKQVFAVVNDNLKERFEK